MGKAQPSAAELAQTAVIGALLMDAQSGEAIFSMLSPCMFSEGPYRRIYECMVLLHGAGKPVDIVTLTASLGTGYQQLLVACAEGAPGISSATAYAQIVFDEWRKAELYQAMLAAEADCITPGSSAEDIVVQLRAVVAAQDALASSADILREGSFSACVSRFLQQYGKKDDAIACGWAELDRARYLCPGWVTVLAARPGSGKTAFALAWAVKLALRVPVIFFSMEMSEKELFCRIASSVLRIDGTQVQSGALCDAQRASMENLMRVMAKQARLFIPDMSKVSGSVLDFIEGCIRTQKPAVVVIDYIGLIGVANTKLDEVGRLSLITRTLKVMAKRHSVAIIELAQLKREVDKNKGGQSAAVLADLRGSGTIEQDSDTVLFLRPEAHDKKMLGNMFCGVDLACLKNRHGPCLTHRFDWFPQHSRYIPVDIHKDNFEELPPDESAPEQQTFSPQKE